MLGGNSDVLTSAGPGLPLGNLSSYRCQARFQYIDWASPCVSISKSLMVREGAGEYFDGSNATDFIGSVVV